MENAIQTQPKFTLPCRVIEIVLNLLYHLLGRDFKHVNLFVQKIFEGYALVDPSISYPQV